MGNDEIISATIHYFIQEPYACWLVTNILTIMPVTSGRNSYAGKLGKQKQNWYLEHKESICENEEQFSGKEDPIKFVSFPFPHPKVVGSSPAISNVLCP